MTYHALTTEPVLHMVSPLGSSWGPFSALISAFPASTTWEAANRTIYVPITIPARCAVARYWRANGATTTGGATITAAIYADAGRKPGRRLSTASATQGTASQVQFVTPSTIAILRPATYWLALASTAATNTTVFAFTFSVRIQGITAFQEATGTPPATATPVARSAATAYLFGFSTVATP